VWTGGPHDALRPCGSELGHHRFTLDQRRPRGERKRRRRQRYRRPARQSGSRGSGGRGPQDLGAREAPRVEVSFERLGKGPCQWLNGSGGKFSKVAADKGKCDQPIWLRASGARKWRYTLRKRLPRGHYLLLVRAVDVGGVSNNSFSARQHNLRNFTVR
jgi:hypothetical protein